MTSPAIQYDPKTALAWSVAAMTNAIERINMVNELEPWHAFAAIGEAVWWVTAVDDNLRRDFRATYDATIDVSVPSPAPTLLGLRSVRNRIGHEVELADFIRPIASRPDRGDGRITAWAWNHVPPPGNQRAVKAYRAYESAVVEGGQGGNIVYTFQLAAGFLRVVHERRSLPKI